MFHQVPAPNILIRLICGVALAAGLAGSVKSPPSAFAATLTITKTDDTNDGVCDSDCSLREAIVAANTASDVDEVILPAGTYSLTLGGLNITNPLTITGALSSTTIIHWNYWASSPGVFHVGTGVTATLSGMTIIGGRSIGAGAINNSGTLILNDSTLTHNIGVLAGAIWSETGATLVVNRSSIVGNTTGLTGFGGGIGNSGTMIITDSLIADNVAGTGGGIYNFGAMTVTTSAFIGNIAYALVTGSDLYSGGGISNKGSLTVINSTFYNNQAFFGGGAIQNFGGTAVISNSNLIYNAAVWGGGISNDGGQVRAGDSTVSNNIGNGLYNRGALTLTNSTISGNRPPTSVPFSDSAPYGSGLYTITGTVDLNNVTIIGSFGNGIYHDEGEVTFRNTSIGGAFPGCVGTLTSQDYNLIQDATGCTITGVITHNIVGQNPNLGFLQDNGGSTLTHPLLSGSPALEAGNPVSPGSGDTACEATDQRGVARPQDIACDIGASEGSYVLPTGVIFSQRDSMDRLGLGMPLTYTILVTNTSGAVATGVRVTDTLPVNVMLASAIASEGSCGLTGSEVVCGPVSLNSGSVLTVTVAVTPTNVSLLLNAVSVTTDATGPNTVNTTLVEPTTVMLFAGDGLVSLPEVSFGAVAWGDYDNDDDLDVLLTGTTFLEWITRLYRNDGNHVFTDINAGLVGVEHSSIAWGDYDNDDDLDVLITGFDGSVSLTQLYRNDGNGSFTTIATGMVGVQKGVAAWGDYDLDGDLDIALTGDSGAGFVAKLYRNDGNDSFTDIQAVLPGVSESAVAWGDYDNDGDPDLAFAGYTGSARIAKLYRNDGGDVFLDTGVGLVGIQRGSVAWGDYDTDGDLDILFAGNDGSPYGGLYAYRNDGNGAFPLVLFLTSVNYAEASWGDYDNDGDLDIVQASEYGWGAVYRNEGDSIFSDARANLFIKTAAWGDDDNDGDLDVLAASYDLGLFISAPTTIYRNHVPVPNTPPTAPTGLSAVVSDTTALLSWNASGDAQTPIDGLSYNLRVGTTPGGSEIVSPMASVSTGYRHLPALGNVQHGLTATLQNLAPGVAYYWSVQAIDTAFAGSPFASEGSFSVPGPVTETATPTATSTQIATLTATSISTLTQTATPTATPTPTLTQPSTPTTTPTPTQPPGTGFRLYLPLVGR